MNGFVAGLASLGCMIGLAGVPAAPAAADSVTVGEPGWSVTLSFPNHQWTSESCQFVPVTAQVSGSVESWTFGGFVTEREDEDGDTNWYIDYDTKVSDGAGAFTFRHAVLLCPGYDVSGAYDVVGEVGVRLTGTTSWSWQPYRAEFTVSGIPTMTTLDSITVADGEARFSGRAGVLAPPPGTFRGCDARVTIQAGTPEGVEEVGDAEPADDGSFVVTIPTYRLTATQYRARLGGYYSICAESTSAAQGLPVRLPRVRVSTNAPQSRLRVDVDPGRGRKAWVFQVQRQKDDGGWRTLKTYRTKGSAETRTINLRKGSYRIHLKAQAGFAETYSEQVWLER